MENESKEIVESVEVLMKYIEVLSDMVFLARVGYSTLCVDSILFSKDASIREKLKAISGYIKTLSDTDTISFTDLGIYKDLSGSALIE